MAAAQQELDAMRRVARDGSAQARAVLKPRALKRHRKRARRREPGKRRKSWPMSSVSWPRANAPKGSRWNRSFSRRAGKSTRSRAARKRPLLSVRRLGAPWRRCNRNSTQCAASRATAARRRVQVSEAARAQAAQEASAASRARQAAEVLANEQRELATRERAKGVALEQELLAARREIDALKGSAQTTAAEREEARRALAAVQQELDAMRRVARDGSAQARAGL